MTAKVANIALDCGDVLLVATFWATVLGRPIDAGASSEFASIGGTDAARAEPAWYFNRVVEPKLAKNRMHLDLIDPDPKALDGLVRAGASVIKEHRLSPGGHFWTVLQDPEGNEFCIAREPFTG